MVVRMFFPVELWFAYDIRVEHVWPFLHELLLYQIVQGAYTMRIWDVLVLLWVAGILVQIGRKLFLYRRIERFIKIFPAKDLGDFLKEKGLKKSNICEEGRVKVTVTEFARSPCLVGLKFGYILLPQNDYTNEEILYIIRHEMLHYRRKDVLKKMITDILCTMFWWNPVFWYLKRSVFHMIEISNDMELTADMTDTEKISYMECLKNVAAKVQKQEILFGVSFSKNSVRELKQRLYLVGEGTVCQSKYQKGSIVFMMGMLLLSFFIIMEPFSMAPEGIPMTSENTYLIQHGDMYDVYLNGEYFFSTDDLIPFQGVTIYKNREGVKNE